MTNNILTETLSMISTMNWLWSIYEQCWTIDKFQKNATFRYWRSRGCFIKPREHSMHSNVDYLAEIPPPWIKTSDHISLGNDGFGRGGLFVPYDDPTPQYRSFLCHFWGVVPNVAFNKVVPPWIWTKLFRHGDAKFGGKGAATRWGCGIKQRWLQEPIEGAWQSLGVHYTTAMCVAVCCGVLQCVAVCCVMDTKGHMAKR